MLDTSVIVPALVEAHPAHTSALRWLRACVDGRHEGAIAAHALAETWAVLTRLPLTTPLSPGLAERVVRRLAERITVLPSDATLYFEAIERCALQGLRSGRVYDALHLVSAERAAADVLVTANERDFARLAKGGTPRIITPTSPPP